MRQSSFEMDLHEIKELGHTSRMTRTCHTRVLHGISFKPFEQNRVCPVKRLERMIDARSPPTMRPGIHFEFAHQPRFFDGHVVKAGVDVGSTCISRSEGLGEERNFLVAYRTLTLRQRLTAQCCTKYPGKAAITSQIQVTQLRATRIHFD